MILDDLLDLIAATPRPVLRKVYVWSGAPRDKALVRDGVWLIHTSWWEELAAEARPPYDGDRLFGVPVLFANGSPAVRAEMCRDLGWDWAWEAHVGPESPRFLVHLAWPRPPY